MKYEKLIKWLLAILFAVGVVLSAYGFIVGWPKIGNGMPPLSEQNCVPVDVILWGAYIFAGVTILAVVFGVFVIGGINNPKNLVKLLLGVVVIVVIVGGAWILAPGSPAIGLVADKAPSDFDLKLTDATLMLTYLMVGASLVSLVVGWIVSATRK